MDGRKMRLKGKWVAYLDELIEIKKQIDVLDKALISELGGERNVLELNSTTMSKLHPHDIDIPFVPNIMLYRGVERIAEDLGLMLRTTKYPNVYVQFFIYKGYEFYEVVKHENACLL